MRPQLCFKKFIGIYEQDCKCRQESTRHDLNDLTGTFI